jgi:hypothetical protein
MVRNSSSGARPYRIKRLPAKVTRNTIQPARLPSSLWKLGYQLQEFGLRPSTDSTGPHVSERAQRKSKFRDVVSVGCIDDDEQIAVAGREIDFLDFDAHFLA